MLLHYDMATNLVRWMKTKFNGYKPFTVISNELGNGRLSDTELLLRPSRFASEESFPSNLHQRRQHSSDCQDCHYRDLEVDSRLTTKEETLDGGKRLLEFDEVECDVSLEDCSPYCGDSQRQEFSFTLYDLDGHGKITKDDIASLVKTIYETLGQSIKVPHYGSKTIKVELTVSPEKNVCKNSDEISSPTLVETHGIPGSTPNDYKWSTDLYSSKTRRQRKYRRERKFRRRRRSISSSGLSEDLEADVSEDDDTPPLNNKIIRSPTLISTEATTIFSKYKRRSSSMRRKELLQIIQDNMDKNKLCFQTSRKPLSNHVTCSSPHRHLEKTGQLFSRKLVNSLPNSLPSEKYDTNKMFLASFKTKNRNDSRCMYQRPLSFELPNNCSAVYKEIKKSKGKHPTSHELKHRHREKEQARAKEQVVRWLEQEFSIPAMKYCNTRKKNNNLNNKNKSKNKNNNNNSNYNNNSKSPSKEDVKIKSHSCSNEKHEHHHVHEHVHHHYHHYRESPILV